MLINMGLRSGAWPNMLHTIHRAIRCQKPVGTPSAPDCYGQVDRSMSRFTIPVWHVVSRRGTETSDITSLRGTVTLSRDQHSAVPP